MYQILGASRWSGLGESLLFGTCYVEYLRLGNLQSGVELAPFFAIERDEYLTLRSCLLVERGGI